MEIFKMAVENSKTSPKTAKKSAQNIPKSDETKQIKVTKTNVDKNTSHQTKKPKWPLVLFILAGFAAISGITLTLIGFSFPKPELATLTFPELPTTQEAPTNIIYSNLTGLPLSNGEAQTAPTYCVQTPNGTDGARPQAGLDQAGVIFEAIAEAGITRFAAIYQAPTSAVIGPIRSLRLYYLQWDTPFDCIITHAGGADDALAALKNGYKDLTENYTYMYRGTAGARLWNNLFTTATDLANFANDRGYTSSNIKGFSRLTPALAERKRINDTVAEKLVITAPATSSTFTLIAKTSHIEIDFGNVPAYNVRYDYNPTTNSYNRSYANGAAHEIYVCPTENLGEKNPEAVCQLSQLSPSVVIAMTVEEHRATDNYHENITTIGSGDAYIFENGIAIKGSWQKSSVADQIRFFDASGTEISLIPGQTFISAVPTYGRVNY